MVSIELELEEVSTFIELAKQKIKEYEVHLEKLYRFLEDEAMKPNDQMLKLLTFYSHKRANLISLEMYLQGTKDDAKIMLSRQTGQKQLT